MRSLLKLPAIGLVVVFACLPQFAAAQAADQMLFFEGDMVAGPESGPTCVLKSQYTHGQTVVWRVRVLDQTGKRLSDKDVKGLIVELPDGQKFPMRYGPHPRGKTDDYFWTAAWKIPASYPTGTFSYKVVATALNGQPQTWSPFKVALSELTIVK